MGAEFEPDQISNRYLDRIISQSNNRRPYKSIVLAMSEREREGLMDYEAQQIRHLELLQGRDFERLEREGQWQYEEEQISLDMDRDFDYGWSQSTNARGENVNGHDEEQVLETWPRVTRQRFTLRHGGVLARSPHKHNTNEEAVADAKENTHFFLKRVMNRWGRPVEKKVPIRSISSLRVLAIALDDFELGGKKGETPLFNPSEDYWRMSLEERAEIKGATDLTFRVWEVYEPGGMGQ